MPSENRKITWNNTSPYVVYFDADANNAFRDRVATKKPLELEIVRELLPKFAHLQDPHKEKYRAKVIIDIGQLTFPRVVGIKGRYYVNQFDAGLGDTQVDNVFKKFGSTLGVEILMDKILLDKKKLQPVRLFTLSEF